MKKLITVFLLMATIVLHAQGKTKKGFPQIQHLLINANGSKVNISQKITQDSFTFLIEVVGMNRSSKTVYQDIDWSSFTNVTTNLDSPKTTDNMLEYSFYFFPKLKYAIYDEKNMEIDKGLIKSFNCYIEKNDQKEFLKIVYGWKRIKINKSEKK